SNEYYGIYEFKKGFGGNVMELIGEFDLVINRFYYYLYKVVIFVYKKVRNIIYR
ncbi:MAG TPA: aminoacyltransferase, partial [Tenericutes bacterium]|nr:aminoacyltransferase [Mycoplasmatota bacterium]